MAERLEKRCKSLIEKREYEKCEKAIQKAMAADPHSAVPHNLMGILMEKKGGHVLAMKHFRAAYGLDPSYMPARFNMEQYGQVYYHRHCAYTEEDCISKED